jgi:hypothetical protein
MFTSSNRTSRLTPFHVVPSLDQCVTQWMSVVPMSAGSGIISFQDHVRVRPVSDVMEKVHESVGWLCAGPVLRTGNPLVRCCPGGRSAAWGSWRL